MRSFLLISTLLLFCTSCVPVWKKKVISNPVQGVLYLNGKPCKKAKVVRFVDREQRQYYDFQQTTFSNQQGEFQLPEVTVRDSVATIIDWENYSAISSQFILVEYQEKHYFVYAALRDDNAKVGDKAEDIPLNQNHLRLHENFSLQDGVWHLKINLEETEHADGSRWWEKFIHAI